MKILMINIFLSRGTEDSVLVEESTFSDGLNVSQESPSTLPFTT